MNRLIRAGIVGYGQVGRGVEIALKQQRDMTLGAVFTRRRPNVIKPYFSDTVVRDYNDMALYEDDIDVMIVCAQSKADLPEMSPHVASMFNMVDSYDIHAEIVEHLDAVDAAAEKGGKTAIIGVGWDPGIFSMQRLLGEVLLPNGQTDTFWGEGLSQGHTAAVKDVAGVTDAVQYTIPNQDALEAARSGRKLSFNATERHERMCYVVADNPSEEKRIAHEIKTMPHYFADYRTTVHFISLDELRTNHHQKKHGGHVIRSGYTEKSHHQYVELTAKFDSNPEFTGSVMAAYARAACLMQSNRQTGAKTVFDIPLTYLTSRPIRDVIREML
ncbi:Diaminopimelate dehydrogenase [Lentibacillus sp. JNUCC-1]|uniref:diaminopimelate dehydrogenase n=1 Tax=Lentibacillus sp. JNUCC-1 TaxID=2654513 RepID=UPI0012E70D08|nr:diaminopimelate dehydrogenase [Lentibacillus sp. JNUCC-1]MUV36613.1 Diaminopimelate dehydrogenase [Lentibacillus sp. JNUCC-1]